ncbi:unnamed protein product [Heterobilharzia americana]|nr:unnamed protein product [Heterobilharzia americana]
MLKRKKEEMIEVLQKFLPDYSSTSNPSVENGFLVVKSSLRHQMLIVLGDLLPKSEKVIARYNKHTIGLNPGPFQLENQYGFVVSSHQLKWLVGFRKLALSNTSRKLEECCGCYKPHQKT